MKAERFWRDSSPSTNRTWTAMDRLNPEGLRRRLTQRLEGLGSKVILKPLPQVAQKRFSKE
jgi:hypothetical protein